MEFEIIHPGLLDQYVGKPDVFMIDLREPEEYLRGHIRGAINIPYERIGQCCIFPRDMTLVLYCQRGASSMAAAKELSRKGYRAKTVAGGIAAYRGQNMGMY